jgi:hypothetical protein
MDDTLKRYMKEMVSKSCGTDVDLSLLNNPNLEADRFTQDFIMKLTNLSTLLNDVTTITRAECKGEIPRFDSCDVPAIGASAKSCLPKFNISHDVLPYDMVKYVVAHSYDQDMIDCNKFGPKIKDIAMEMLMTSWANSMEYAAILGDEDIPTGDDYSNGNNLLGVNDGWLKIAGNETPAAQIIDAAGKGPSSALMMAARKALPPRYRRNRADYRFIGGPGLNDWWTESQGGRLTAAGDQAIATGNGGRIWGNEVYEVAQWPEHLNYGGEEVTHMLFTPLSNLVHMVQRKLNFKTEYDFTCDRYLTVGFFKQDFLIADPDAVVLVKNVDLCNTADPYVGCNPSPADGCAITHDPLA